MVINHNQLKLWRPRAFPSANGIAPAHGAAAHSQKKAGADSRPAPG